MPDQFPRSRRKRAKETHDRRRRIDHLPRWSIADVFRVALGTIVLRGHGAVDRRCRAPRGVVRRTGHPGDRAREADAADGEAADRVLREFNRVAADFDIVEASIYATVSTNSRDEQAQGLMSELEPAEAAMRPLLARLSDWVQALGAASLARVSDEAARAPRATHPTRGACRPPDVGGRGAPVRRVVGHRIGGVGPPATRRHVAVVGRGRPARRAADTADARRTRSRHRRPTPTFVEPPTKPRWRRGRPSKCPSPRR